MQALWATFWKEVLSLPRIDDYLKEVASQVRVKRIRKNLTDELRDHLELQKSDYLAEGLNEEAAEARAVQEMGDALMVGGELDRVHRPHAQWKGVLAALAVMLVGLALRVFLYSNETQMYVPVDMGLSILLGAGIVALLGTTDYAWWLKLTWPVCGLWMLCGLHAAAWGPSDGLVALRLPFFVQPLERLTPEMITSVMPLMTALLMCKMRGRGWGGFLVGLSAVGMGMVIYLTYIRYSLRYYPLGAMLLLSLGTAFFAVKRGFFRIDRKKAYGVLWLVGALIMLRLLLGSAPVVTQDVMGKYVYPLLERARLFGSAGPNAENTQALMRWQFLLPYMIVKLGWLPFAVLLAGMVLALIRCVRRLWRMENSMGSLLGVTSALTLCMQTAMYLLYSFTNVHMDVGLPLISEGIVMLLVDSLLAGVMLSVMRGENLPEETTSERRRSRTA